jgi:hypothetical protein
MTFLLRRKDVDAISTHHECEAEPAKLHTAPSMAPLALAEARVSQVEAELRLLPPSGSRVARRPR